MGAKSRYIYAATMGAVALGIGGAMQYGPMGLHGGVSSNGAPILPVEPEYIHLSSLPMVMLHDVTDVSSQPEPTLAADEVFSQPAPACEIVMTAQPAAAAMVDLRIDAPCHANAPVTIHHSGMMFTEKTDSLGGLQVDVPALAEHALFMADFGENAAAVATTDVNSFIFYDRAVVQWQGQSDLELHAREFTEDYDGKGHVWRDSKRTTRAAATGTGGMLIELGNSNMPGARIAEVYTYPTLTSDKSGDVFLSIEAEVTAQNCAQDLNAQVLQVNGSDRVRVQDIVVSVPECDAVGELLVLQNLLDDLKIAAR